MDIKKLLGSNVKKYRKANGLTQEKLAEIIDVEQKHISFIESGNSFPSPALISKLAGVFKIKPKDLLDFEEAPTLEFMRDNIIKMISKMSYEDITKIHNFTNILYTNKN